MEELGDGTKRGLGSLLLYMTSISRPLLFEQRKPKELSLELETHTISNRSAPILPEVLSIDFYTSSFSCFSKFGCFFGSTKKNEHENNEGNQIRVRFCIIDRHHTPSFPAADPKKKLDKGQEALTLFLIPTDSIV